MAAMTHPEQDPNETQFPGGIEEVPNEFEDAEPLQYEDGQPLVPRPPKTGPQPRP